MSETIPPPPPAHDSLEAAAVDPPAFETTPATEPRPARDGSRALRVLCAIGFLLLFVGLGWLWREQQQMAARQSGFDPAAFAGMESQVRTLTQRLATLEQKPPPSIPTPPPPPPPVDLGPLNARISALEKRPDVPPVDPAIVARMDDLQSRLSRTQADAARNGEVVARNASLRSAQAALDAGQPLGDMPGAPPALSRFGRAKPPTEASLRLAFPDAAERAVAASKPATDGETVGQRMWQNARALVTIKQGDKVVLGAPAAETIGQARERLDAGDLAGAVAALGALDGPAAQAMADWRDQAKALVEARAALAGMARG